MSVLWQQSTHGVPKRREKMDRVLARAFLLVVVVVALLTAAYLTLMFSNLRISERVWRTAEELLEVQRENQRLRVETARLSSIPVLQERSVALGYQPAQSIEYVVVGGP